jgi:hypothetical protein
LKALSKFFLILFVINLPLMMMYHDYQDFLTMTKIKVKGLRRNKDGALSTFAKISMGNLKYMEKNSPTVNTALISASKEEPKAVTKNSTPGLITVPATTRKL